jgi:hypothetical protein
LTLRILPQAPVISSAYTANGTIGSAFSHQITASNNPISYSVTGILPNGLSLNETSGLISGTPGSAGNATVTISAANSGGSGNQSLILRILPSGPTSQTPVATAPPATPPAAQNSGRSTSMKKSKGNSAKKSKGVAKKSKGKAAKKSKKSF